ncbi:MAG: hypothetical protein IH944_01855 [Armatimonadetes bacterium]|nr:hypothetical protein [Armatimonadota bacterium]
MRKKRKVWWIVGGVLAFVVLFAVWSYNFYVDSQRQYARTALNMVRAELRTELAGSSRRTTSVLRKKIEEETGDIQSFTVDDAYPLILWHSVYVDGYLKADTGEYWFRCWVDRGDITLVAVMPLSDGRQDDSVSSQ